MNNELCSICGQPSRRFCSRCASFVCIDCVQFQAHQDADAKYQAEHAYDVPEYSVLDMMEESAPAQPTLYTARDMTDVVRVVHEQTYHAAAVHNHATTEEERREAARRFDGWMGVYNRVDVMRRAADRYTGDALRDYERRCMEEIREEAMRASL